MTENNVNIPKDEYRYGFSDKDVSIYRTKKGINREIVEEISKLKGEPEWMTQFRLKAYESFMAKDMPTWGANLSQIDFDDYTYYIKPSERMENRWEDVPVTIKDTFAKLGIPEAEAKFWPGFPRSMNRKSFIITC
jgi:Fe-S cluster assembly protein SufB